MAVKAVCWICHMINTGSNPAALSVKGRTTDGAVGFSDEEALPAIHLSGLDWDSATLQSDVEAAVKAKLAADPYNVSFDTGDTVHFVW